MFDRALEQAWQWDASNGLVLDHMVYNPMFGLFLAIDKRIVYSNERMAEIFGYMNGQLVGMHLTDLFVSDELLRHIQHSGKLLDEMLGSSEIRSILLRGRRSNGEPLYVEGTFQYRRVGDQTALLCTAVDITDRINSEANNQRQYEQLLKLSPEPIVLHREGIITYINDNALRLFGVSDKDTLLGRKIIDFFHSDYHPIIRRRMQEVLKTQHPLEFVEVRFIREDGTVLDVEVSSVYVYKHVNTPVVQTVIRDVTTRKETEEYIRNSEKLSLVGQLAAGIAHEIRNPLTALKGFAQLLKAKGDEKEAYMDIMLTELERINHIVNEFMIIAKPHINKFEERDLCKTIYSVIDLLETQAIMKNVEIQYHTSFHTGLVECIEDQLKQVFINVIKNAIEAVGYNGIVRVTLSSSGMNYAIRVEDNGQGIPEDKLPLVGKPFFTTKESGTGLGLMVCYRIMENHKGNIRIESEYGKGTMVEITLPIYGR